MPFDSAMRWGSVGRVVIATKVGMEMGPDRKGLSKKYIRRAVDESLKRLQVDTIDLYQSHTDDMDTPLEETLETYARLIEAGKVRAIGASNYTAARLAEALELSRTQGLPRYETLQPHYNLMERAGYENELEPLCRKEGLGVISFFGLARGFLSGKYRSEADLSKSPRGDGVKEYRNPRGMGVLAALDVIAAVHHAAPASVALAWLMARPGLTAPIASATSLAQFEQLAQATRLELDAGTIARLDEASAA